MSQTISQPLKNHIMNAMGRVSDARRQAIEEKRSDVLDILIEADRKLAQALGEVSPVTPDRFKRADANGVARPIVFTDHQLAEDAA